jgi:hypothetical protein
VVSIGTSSPRELFTVIAVTGLAIALVVAPLLSYAGPATVVTDGVDNATVVTGVDSEVTRSTFGQPRVTVHVVAGEARRITANTRTGTAVDSVRLAPTQTSVTVGCEQGRTCVLRVHAADGTTLDTVTVTVVADG